MIARAVGETFTVSLMLAVMLIVQMIPIGVAE